MKTSENRKYIKIRGANEHNLKNIDVDIPRDEFVVLTGLSGSGKSSLAFDTIYAEGQRRYMESLSSYARQFLGQMEKPNVEKIEGLSPAISIDQKSTNRNPRSTVGTVTEIYDYFRLLYARVGIPHCLHSAAHDSDIDNIRCILWQGQITKCLHHKKSHNNQNPFPVWEHVFKYFSHDLTPFHMHSFYTIMN